MTPIIRQNVLNRAECARIVLAFLENRHLTVQSGDEFFLGRVLWVSLLRAHQRNFHELREIEYVREYAGGLIKNSFYPHHVYDDGPQIVEWPPGYSMPPHIDNAADCPTPWRDWACVLYLNDGYEGGALEFLSPRQSYKLSAGSLIVFPGSEPHAVTEVTKGMRYTLPIWFTTDASKAQGRLV
jgi:hypothetical protein